jgi:amino acid transporter
MPLNAQPGQTRWRAGHKPASEQMQRSPLDLLRTLLFGKPIATEHQEHSKLPKYLALPVFSSDAISSTAYATQEILLVLGAAGLWVMSSKDLYSRLGMGITVGIVSLLFIVVASYYQTVFAYPQGGGSYIVSKNNLGILPGLVAASALLIDYVMTVAVSISSGVQNLVSTPFAQHLGLHNHVVPVCVTLITIVTLLNMRGLKESGALFAGPTYLFIGMAVLMISLGVAGSLGLYELNLGAIEAERIRAEAAGLKQAAGGISGMVLLGVVLRGFANGCSAMTGTEAVSDGIPAFRKPESRNASITLIWMAIILGFLFVGISYLATQFHVVYVHYGHGHGAASSSPVIEQLANMVFGQTGAPWRVALYYTMQISTMLILVLAANTAFADFPRLSYFLSRDRYLPRQLANVGDKLVYTNGILMLGFFASLLVILYHGSVDRLIPLYAVGVFTAFTLSQSGMVKRWFTERGPGWRLKATINGFGAMCTGIVMINVLFEKFLEGAWIVVVTSVVLVFMFRGIWNHYENCRRCLSLVNREPDREQPINTVLLVLPSLHQGVFPALNYAKSLSQDCRAIHIEIDPADTPRLIREWDQYVGPDTPLVIMPSPFRSLVAPLVRYVREVSSERPNHVVTVVVPEFVPGKWYHRLLHSANGLLVKHYLSHLPGVIVSNVRYFLVHEQGKVETPPMACLTQPNGAPEGMRPDPNGGD